MENKKIESSLKMLSVLVLTIIALAILYYLLTRPYGYWLKKGVKQGSPVVFFGDNWGPFIGKYSFAKVIQNLYNISSTERYVGMYQFLQPILVLRDLELIKQITVRDFDHFSDRHTYIPEDIDPLWGGLLFSLTGKKWKTMRSIITPAFSNIKLKFMFTLMKSTGEKFLDFFTNQNQDMITIDMKEISTRFTSDVMANTIFGFESDSFQDRENTFYLMGKEAGDFTGFWKSFKFLGYMVVPALFKLFHIRIFSLQVSDFFKELIRNNVKHREKHGIDRQDMIQLLMEARKEYRENPNLISDQDLASQVIGMLVGGFESITGLICFMSYELAVNPQIQNNLIEEIDSCNGNDITYEILEKLKYLDMVISETLRKWPTNVAIERICTKPYIIEPKTNEEKPIHLQQNDMVWIPVFAIHRDPEIYPDPEKFDPERFNNDNKTRINKNAFLAFGSGYRNCIGSRFALLETKIFFFYLLSQFQIVPVKKTHLPLEISKRQLSLNSKHGFWFGLERRNK